MAKVIDMRTYVITVLETKYRILAYPQGSTAQLTRLLNNTKRKKGEDSALPKIG